MSGFIFFDMQSIISYLNTLCENLELPAQYIPLTVALTLVVAFIVLIFILQRGLNYILVTLSHLWAKRTPERWDDAFCEAFFPGRVAHLIISLLCQHLDSIVFGTFPETLAFVTIGANIYFALAIGGTAFAFLNALLSIFSSNDRLKDVPIKGFFQAVKIIIALGIGIWILSILSNKSPAYFLSGIGALMAILLIVFKDALLGFTAGIMISTNDLVRNKDWIEIPGTPVDGEVFDVSLTTVKVRNWDNSISNVPAYTLISGAFKNWRGMEKSGGRRIKRAINIDMQTIRFATKEEISHWQQIDLLKPYLAQKLSEIKASNAKVSPTSEEASPANIRLLTNIGTFRAYCLAYLKANKNVHLGMTLIVRQLNPGPTGLPLEIYVFTNDTRWAFYENIQSDIFDHLLAILPEFGLAPFQVPSGRNFDAIRDDDTRKLLPFADPSEAAEK